jgi:hypothetical protein
MAVTATRSVSIGISGDGLNESNVFPAASNVASPGNITYVSLASGSNTITTTTGVVAATIIPPAGNTQSITLKGVTGDTGVRLHNTDPSSIGLDSSVSSFILTAGGTVTGVRIIWT